MGETIDFKSKIRQNETFGVLPNLNLKICEKQTRHSSLYHFFGRANISRNILILNGLMLYVPGNVTLVRRQNSMEIEVLVETILYCKHAGKQLNNDGAVTINICVFYKQSHLILTLQNTDKVYCSTDKNYNAESYTGCIKAA